ncbi:tRNA-dihydrouridine synthase family protein [bacterium]|nr:tRNA-dihydrouridine synthase family protein [bacterium]
MFSQDQILEKLTEPIIAPLSGYTSLPFRELLRQNGFTGLYFPEMINPFEIARGKFDKTFSFKEDQPYGIQLFGGFQKGIFQEAIHILLKKADPVLLDLNMGCPVKKILKTGGGVKLLERKDDAKAILEDIRKVWKGPLSIKTRIGFTLNDIEETVSFLKELQVFDLTFITVHFRTVAEGFSPPPHWELYKQFKDQLDVPLILNGGIYSVAHIREIKEKISPDGIMLARGILMNPLLFKEKTPSLNEKIDMAKFFIKKYSEIYGERRLHEIRKFMVFLFKGEIYSKALKEKLFSSTNLEEYLESFTFYRM